MNISKFGGIGWDGADEFERAYGMTLPMDYKEFLAKYNGGKTPRTDFHSRKGGSDVRYFYGVGDVKESFHSLALEEWLEQGVLPVAADSYGNYFVMDVSKKPGQMYFSDHEEDFALIPVTGSFKEFIRKCTSEEVDMELATKPIAARETWMIEHGNGHRITDTLRACWQAEIDKYTGMVLERVKLS